VTYTDMEKMCETDLKAEYVLVEMDNLTFTDKDNKVVAFFANVIDCLILLPDIQRPVTVRIGTPDS